MSRINHLLYVDDLKLYAGTQDQLDSMLRIVDTFSKDIKMSFGLDKCKTLKVVRGKIQETTPANVSGQEIQAMQDGEVYKYLGMKQARRIEHTTIKQELLAEFTKRLCMLLKTGLNRRNMTKAINTIAVPVLTYSFGIIRWSKSDLDSLERKVRTTMTRERKHHPKSSVERMSLPRVLPRRPKGL